MLNDELFPSRNLYNLTQFLDFAFPVSPSIDIYLSQPKGTRKDIGEVLSGAVKATSIQNSHNWNITKTTFIIKDQDPSEHFQIPDLHIYFMTTKQDPLSIVWWEIESSNKTSSQPEQDAALPPGLMEKLLSNGYEDNDAQDTPSSPKRKVTLGLPLTLLLVGLAVCLVTGAAAWISTKYQTRPPRGIYRPIPLNENESEEEEEEEQDEPGAFRRSMTA